MKYVISSFLLILIYACQPTEQAVRTNPFVKGLNEPVDYANATAEDVTAYAQYTLEKVSNAMSNIKAASPVTFENTIVAMDELSSDLGITASNCHMLYYVSPDAMIRESGLAGSKLMDSLSVSIFSDKEIFKQIQSFASSEAYQELTGYKKIMVDDLLDGFKQSGVNLNDEDLARFKQLNKEIQDLNARYTNNMSSSNELLTLDEAGAAGLSENFKKSYAAGEMKYEIPIINATAKPVLANASNEETRKAYYMKFYNRAADQNVSIIDTLMSKRYELGQLMGYDSYAGYNLKPKMAKNPETVWNFVNDLVAQSKAKAASDLAQLEELRAKSGNDTSLDPWDQSYYSNQLMKLEYNVDAEKIREYLPTEACLEGLFTIYQNLLGLTFKKVENGSVWHEEVTMYEVYEGEKLKGIFYLDLYPRPNKETWFYCVPIRSGRATKEGYEVPVAMLLGNFTRATETLPSMLSHSELSTLFHEFGHIMDKMSYEGEFALQADSKRDFVEAMSQIFENWIWDYETLSSFAKHYQTGEVLPKETFDNMLLARTVGSGYGAITQLKRCMYDLNLYDKYDPANPIDTDELWKTIDDQIGIPGSYVPGTHYQASWIHINTHPVYYYGYIWSDVYAQDMFSQFSENGLHDQETGKRYRKLILANGSQRDVVEAVEEFLGRPSNNEAYIESLGL